MTSYLPRFTLRRALIAIGLLGLFLGWLRPDRARIYSRISVPPMWEMEIRPSLFPDEISVVRFDYHEEAEWRISVRIKKAVRPQSSFRPSKQGANKVQPKNEVARAQRVTKTSAVSLGDGSLVNR